MTASDWGEPPAASTSDDSWGPPPTASAPPASDDGWGAPPSSAPALKAHTGPVAQARRFTRALQSGKPLGKALLTTSIGKAVGHAETSVRDASAWAGKHPVDALLDVLGAPQRVVGALIGQVEHNPGFVPRPDDLTPAGQARIAAGRKVADKALYDAAFHPTQAVQAATTESVRALVHAPTKASIHAWVDKHVPKALAPYVSGTLGAAEDTGLQTASDPLTYVPGVDAMDWVTRAARFVAPAIRDAHAAKAVVSAARAAGLGPAFDHLAAYGSLLHHMTAAAGKMVAPITKAAKKSFAVRPELDTWFTPTAKKVRLAIENSELSRTMHESAADARALKTGLEANAKDRFLGYISRFGTAAGAAAARALGHVPDAADTVTRNALKGFGTERAVRARLSDFLASTPEEQAETLATMRHQIQRARVGQATQNYVERFGGLRPGVEPPLKWESIPINAGKQIGYIHNPFAAYGNLYRRTVMLFPQIHGLKNVGQLAVMAGGFDVVPEAIKTMVKGAAAKDVRALENIGAAPTYMTAREGQSVMHRMELGWRIALMHKMDRALGPAKNAEEKMLRGHYISDHIGDYNNQSAFVNFFHTIGGPFVAFRLGIVPHNMIAALRSPAGRKRVLAMVRAEVNLQNNRTPEAQKANRINVGGPIGDFAQMLFNPASFLLSPSTTGVLGQVAQAVRYEQPLSQTLNDTAQNVVPYYEAASKTLQALLGNPMPGQRRLSLADRLAAITAISLGIYYSKLETPQQERKDEARRRKQGP